MKPLMQEAPYPSLTAPERYADGLVHAISLIGLAIASGFLISQATYSGSTMILLGTVAYITTVLFSICVSFAYHLLPRDDLRPVLRRWDHAAIYLVIAGTFTPLMLAAGTWSSYLILGAVWTFALMGFVFKLFANDIDTKWSLYSYLGLGWFALFALPDFIMQLPILSTSLIACGGLCYTVGTLFYRSNSISFRYAIWHIFGTLGGVSFLIAIWIALAWL